MIRTRDFLLFVLTVLFLVAGISATVVRDILPSGGQVGTAVIAIPDEVPPPVERKAEVGEGEILDRPSLLASMREKVAALGGALFAEAPAVVPEDTPPATDEEDSQNDDRDDNKTPLTCPSYGVVAWSSFPGARFKEVEGARLVYRPLTGAAPVVTDASSTSSLAPEAPTEEVLAQLPLRTSPLPTPSCLPQDVVGIASDGSLIRNNEVALYSVFGGETLIGYALDGFPIYGVNTALATDSCGGAMVGGMYRYYLDADRDYLIRCFSGSPVSL